jgi:peptidase M23-like protein
LTTAATACYRGLGLQSWQRHPTLFLLVALLAAASLAVPAAASAWTWPVDGPVLRGFLFSEDNPLAPGQHRGIDIQAALGDSVLAPAAGTVTFVGRVAANGLTVTIEAPDGYAVTLLHLGASLVARGTVVAEGQPVAIVGTSGVPEYSVPYVQLGVRLSSDPEGYVDPQVFLPPLAPPSAPPTSVPGPQSAPALPPAPATPPPTAARPVVGDRLAPRAAAPVAAAPNRPATEPDVRRATPTAEPSFAVQVAPAHPPSAATVASTATDAALARHPLDTNLLRASTPQPTARRQPGSPESTILAPAAAWVRPLDPITQLVAGSASQGEHGSVGHSRDVLIAFAAVLAALSLCAACGFGRRAARIMDADALLPDDADLLRELEPAHRARVHDDRRGRARPAPQAAR